MLSDKDMRRRMAKGWINGKIHGTICGLGSTMENTEKVRQWLPEMCRKYNIRSVNDAGAGDLHWIKHIDWDVDYRPFDLFPRKPEVKYLDITTEDMPPADAVLCRHVLNHLVNGEDRERVEMALQRFTVQHIFLFATNFIPRPGKREFVRLRLDEWLGPPLESCEDSHEYGCTLDLWRLS